MIMMIPIASSQFPMCPIWIIASSSVSVDVFRSKVSATILFIVSTHLKTFHFSICCLILAMDCLSRKEQKEVIRK